MKLTDKRHEEIEETIDIMLKPYESNLDEFSLEKIREQYNIWLIGTTQDIPEDSYAIVLPMDGKYIIAINTETQITSELMGHELAHIVLKHIANRITHIQGLSYEDRWKQLIAKMEKPSLTRAHSPTEASEADYFNKYLHKRLSGVDWIKDVSLKDLDNLK